MPGWIGESIFIVRLAECHYELGNTEKADELFLEAYMLEGIEIFDNEDEYKEHIFKMLKDKGEI